MSGREQGYLALPLILRAERSSRKGMATRKERGAELGCQLSVYPQSTVQFRRAEPAIKLCPVHRQESPWGGRTGSHGWDTTSIPRDQPAART